MRLIRILTGAALLALAAVASHARDAAKDSPKPAGRPNIVFILVDDIAPTLLDLAGAPIPENMAGHSILPLFGDASTPWRKDAFFEYYQEKMYPRTPTWQAYRDDGWKYIHYTELEGMDELFDLKNDPCEMKNLINEKSARKTLAGMKAALEKARASSGVVR